MPTVKGKSLLLVIYYGSQIQRNTLKIWRLQCNTYAKIIEKALFATLIKEHREVYQRK